MIAHYQHNAMISEAMYSGCEILDKEVLPFILDYRPWKKATPKLIASELKKGKIIGVCRGDSETGPRALGNRTILADPRSHRSKDDINKKVKFREWFRPFAPICKEEKASIYFNTSENACYKYMSFSPNVRDNYQTTLPAVTHIDGSSRLQTISKTENEFIYNILDEFENITGVPVLINTSFNSRGKSILTHYQTAIQILDSTQLDSVILGDYYIYK
jgi:carbamoyltransferase